MNAFGRVFDILIFCVVGFVIPVLVVACLTERVAITSAGVAVQKFAENVSTKGYVTRQMYENYKMQLDSTGILFNSDMKIDHEVLAPEYEMRSIEDAEDYLNGLWNGTNELRQGTVTTSLPSVSDPGVPPAGTITATQTNSTSTEGPSGSHVHTDNCYHGEKHVHTSDCNEPNYISEFVNIYKSDIDTELWWDGAKDDYGNPISVCPGTVYSYSNGRDPGPYYSEYFYHRCDYCGESYGYHWSYGNPGGSGTSNSYTKASGESCGKVGVYRMRSAEYTWEYDLEVENYTSLKLQFALHWNTKVTKPNSIKVNGITASTYHRNNVWFVYTTIDVVPNQVNPIRINLTFSENAEAFAGPTDFMGVFGLNVFPTDAQLYGCYGEKVPGDRYVCSYCIRYNGYHQDDPLSYGNGYGETKPFPASTVMSWLMGDYTYAPCHPWNGPGCTGDAGCSYLATRFCSRCFGFVAVPGLVWTVCGTCGGTGVSGETVRCNGEIVVLYSGGDENGWGVTYGCRDCGIQTGSNSSREGLQGQTSGYHNATYNIACPECVEYGSDYPVVTTLAAASRPSPSNYYFQTRTIGGVTYITTTERPAGTLGGWRKKLSCGKTEGVYYNADGSLSTPLCHKFVMSVTPIAPKQALSYGQSPDVRVKAVFADGHSEIVNATLSGFNANQCNTVQTVTLTYGSYKGVTGQAGSMSCTVKLTVRYPFVACEYGHMHYRVNGDNTLCPYCQAYPKAIQVLGVDAIPFYITKGRSLQDSGMYLRLTYYDGHTRVITSGWTDNLDKNYVGLQTVTIGYLGASTTLLVYNERVKVPCAVCGYEYYLYPDNTDPGCPKCLAAIPVFTGNVLRYRETVSYGEILNELYHGEGIYRFSRGDRLEIEVWKVGDTGLNNVLERIFHKDTGNELVGMYGVRIRDEIQEKR